MIARLRRSWSICSCGEHRRRGAVSEAISLRILAESTGLSKRAVQEAITTLERRRLALVHRAHPLAVPAYEILRPWRRLGSVL